MAVFYDQQPVYRPHSEGGIKIVASATDGYTINIEWERAYPSNSNYAIAYNIYYSSVSDDVFSEGVKFVSTPDGYLTASLLSMVPGETYYFAVRATQYQLAWYILTALPDGFPYLKIYSEGLLLSDITADDLIIPVSDIESFPAYGVVLVGSELISYSNIDLPTNSLIVSERGFLNSNTRLHQTDGYDGVNTLDSLVRFWSGIEDDNTIIMQETSTFAPPNIAFTTADGYATDTDKFTVDFSASDGDLMDFSSYDYVGWHRTDPARLMRGGCGGTYIGGEQWCADGYLGVGRQLRGVPLYEQAARREEVLLRTTGEGVMLVKRLWEGIRCSCMYSTTEHPALRCARCFGTGFISGYEQFLNPRRSDGRTLVRFGPVEDDLKYENAGLESTAIMDCWGLGYPTIKDRDFIIRYDRNGNEEFRYEVLHVTRNVLIDGIYGVQKFKAQRIRKTSPIYAWKAISNTATIPTDVMTSIGMMAGPGGTIIPHTHQIVINEGMVALSQINQTTSVTSGHNHVVKAGIVQSAINHSHTIILP